MIPTTPQKKDSLDLQCNESVNYSFVWNQSQHHHHLQKSIFRVKVEDPFLKNSQSILNKKQTNRVLGKKYLQQDNIFKSKQIPVKQYRQVVISDEFVRSSKLYKMLKEQVAISDAKHVRDLKELTTTLKQQEQSTKQIKEHNHKLKFNLWEHRNEMLELKNLLEEEEQQNKKLVEQYQYLEAEEAEEANEGEEPSPNSSDQSPPSSPEHPISQ